MPVAVKITGCIENGYLISEETDFGTHKVSRKESPYKNKIKAVDAGFKPIDLSSYEGRRVVISGHLLPGDMFIIEQKNIKVLGWCISKTELPNNKDNAEKEKLSLNKKSESMPKGKKAITDQKAQELIWALPEIQEHSKRIKNNGNRPFTRIDARPEDASANENFYIIYFGEDNDSHVVNVMTFYVNSFTEEIYVYDPITDAKYPIEQWRKIKQ